MVCPLHHCFAAHCIPHQSVKIMLKGNRIIEEIARSSGTQGTSIICGCVDILELGAAVNGNVGHELLEQIFRPCLAFQRTGLLALHELVQDLINSNPACAKETASWSSGGGSLHVINGS
jgi:hypothetical protein